MWRGLPLFLKHDSYWSHTSQTSLSRSRDEIQGLRYAAFEAPYHWATKSSCFLLLMTKCGNMSRPAGFAHLCEVVGLMVGSWARFHTWDKHLNKFWTPQVQGQCHAKNRCYFPWMDTKGSSKIKGVSSSWTAIKTRVVSLKKRCLPLSS